MILNQERRRKWSLCSIKKVEYLQKILYETIKNNFAYVCFDIGGDLIPEFDNEIALSKMNS